MAESHYNILGVSESASQDEIKKAYRSLSLKFHPDKNNGSDSNGKYQKINEAYEVLGDDQKKEEYDALKKNRNPFFHMANGSNMDIPIDNIFNAIFGGGMQGFMPQGGPFFNQNQGQHGNQTFHFVQGLQKPTPIIKNISITLEQVYSGSNIPIEIERWLVENGTKVIEKEIIYLTIPKGIDDGEMVVLREKGNVISDTVKGDIKIFIRVEPNNVFKRKGLDILVDHKISLKDALCGFTMEYKHINSKTYTLNNNSVAIQPGYTKTIAGMGLTRETHTGNLVLIFNIEFPTQLTEEQKKIIRETL